MLTKAALPIVFNHFKFSIAGTFVLYSNDYTYILDNSEMTDGCHGASLGNALTEHGEPTQTLRWVSVFRERAVRNRNDLSQGGHIRSLRGVQNLTPRSNVLRDFLSMNPPLESVLILSPWIYLVTFVGPKLSTTAFPSTRLIAAFSTRPNNCHWGSPWMGSCVAAFVVWDAFDTYRV